MKILFIDDSEFDRLIARRWFSDHDVTTVTTLREAIEVTKSIHFDVIFCDVNMPPEESIPCDVLQFSRTIRDSKIAIYSGNITESTDAGKTRDSIQSVIEQAPKSLKELAEEMRRIAGSGDRVP